MQWNEQGWVVRRRRYGETSLIVDLLTREHGRSAGMLKGGRTGRAKAVAQLGNLVDATWRARTQDRLGTYSMEPIRNVGLTFAPRDVVYAFHSVFSLIRLFPEGQPIPELFDAFGPFAAGAVDRTSALNLLVGVEKAVLSQAGYPMDLERCAVTGVTTDLTYVSPRTGRAVSRTAGEGWRDRLLPLPEFLRSGLAEADDERLAEALVTTGALIARVMGAQGAPVSFPPERRYLIAGVSGRGVQGVVDGLGDDLDG